MNEDLDHETMRRRGQVGRAVVHGIDDTGGDQMLVLEQHAGMVRQQVPVHQPFGFASHAPHDGAVTLMHAAGGDYGDPVALPPANPSAARFGNLGEGESVHYDASGQRLHFRNGTLVEVQAVSQLTVVISGSTVLVLTETAATLNVPLQVNGSITAAGDITAGTVSLQGHVHSGVQRGNGNTDKPVA